jgi:flagellar M-ring protein FliF
VVSPTLTPYTPGASSQEYLKEERTVNNALGKELTTEKAAPGGVERLSIAVVLDSNTLGATDTTTVQQLVASASGVDAARGDIVQVDKLPFDTAAAEEATKELAQAEAAARTAGYVDLGQKAGLVLLAVIVGVVIMMRRKKGAPASLEVSASDLPDGVLMPARLDALAAERLRELGPGPAEDATAIPVLDRDGMRDEVASFVDSQPEEIAQLVQGWLAQRSN